MSSSFQSTSYQSFAQPVDTFVEPVKVLPKTNMMALAETLKVINPVLEKFIETKIDERRAEISEEAMNDALDSSTNDWADASKYVRDNKLFSGNRLYNKVFKRTKATILGGSLESKFKTEYESATVDGVPLSNFSLDSLEFSDWLNETRTEVINSLGDVDSDTFNKKFFPYLINATTKITDIHEKRHEEFQVEKLKIDASSLAKNIINFQTAGPDSDDVSKNQFLLLTASIDQFENDINKLGLSSKNRSAINKTILDSLSAEAKRIGFDTGDVDLALSIFKSADQFPFGPSGQLTLLDHPDYVEMENKLREDVEDYTDKSDRRDRAEAKRAKEEALDIGVMNMAALFTAGKTQEAIALQEELQSKFPLLATKIQANAQVLNGDTNERYAQLLFNINQGNVYETLSDARIAAMSWYLNTDRSNLNTTRLNSLMTLAGSVDKGLLAPLNSYFTTYEGRSKNLLTSDSQLIIFSKISKEQQLNLVKVNLEEFKQEFREWRLSNENAGSPEINAEYERLAGIYDAKLLAKLKGQLDPSSEQTDNNTEFINQNQSGLEGVATDGGTNNNNETGDFFGNTTLPSVESRVIAELTRMGGITKENRDKLLEEVVAEKAKMNFTNIVGKSEADRIIRFLQTGEYGFGGEGPRVYQPMKLLVDTDNLEASAFTDDDSPTTVEVEQGDTLSELADQFGSSVQAIMEANNLTNPDMIRVGQELVMPIVERVNMKEVKNNQIQALNVILKDTDKTKVIPQPKIEDMLLAVGFEPEIAKIMAAVAMAESAGNPMIDTVKSGLDPQKKKEFSIGLLQLNMKDDKDRLLDVFDIESEEELYDPIINVIAAKRLYDEQGLDAWGAYKNGSYKKFLKN
jgi:molybdopterin converting factor small subunit